MIRHSPTARYLGVAAFLVLAAAVACNPTTGIDSEPPEVTITEPLTDARFEQSDTITFKGFAEDPEDGPLTGSALAWKSDIDGPLGSGEELSVAAADMASGSHTITLAATDSDNVTGSASTMILIVQPPS